MGCVFLTKIGVVAIYYLLKVIISAALIVFISEISKRSSLVGALTASVPVISVLAMVWLYKDTHNITAVASLAKEIFWLVLPSLSLFLTFPLLVQYRLKFYPALSLSLVIMVGCYFIMIFLLRRFG